MLKNKILNFSVDLKIFESIELCQTSFGSLVVLKNNNKKSFLKIPSEVSYVKKDGFIIFSVADEANYSLLTTFKNLFNDTTTATKSVLKKKLELNGLGFKINITKEDLNLKLGYSHPIILDLPSEINRVNFAKKKLSIESSDKIKLGNFAKRIFLLKKYDCYKGKGFSFVNVKKRLKEIKKK